MTIPAIPAHGASWDAWAVAIDAAARTGGGGVLAKWKPSTAYTAGDIVLNPTGQTVQANTTFTSGTTYNAANWTIVGSQVLAQDTGDDAGVYAISAAAPGGTLTTPIPGDSAYQVWLNAGNTGTQADFLNSLKGTPGAAGTEYTTSTAATWTGTVDLSAYTTPVAIEATLTGNVTSITLPTPAANKSYPIMLVLTQDSTGGRTIAWPTAPLSAAGIDPVLSTAAGAIDLVHLLWTGARWVLIAGAMNLA